MTTIRRKQEEVFITLIFKGTKVIATGYTSTYIGSLSATSFSCTYYKIKVILDASKETTLFTILSISITMIKTNSLNTTTNTREES